MLQTKHRQEPDPQAPKRGVSSGAGELASSARHLAPCANSVRHEGVEAILGLPKLLDSGDIQDGVLRARLNESLLRISGDPDPLRVLLVRMRCEVLKSTRANYPSLLGAHTSTVVSFENQKHRLTPENHTARTLHSISSGWKQLAKERKGEIADALRKGAGLLEELASRTLQSPIAAMLYRWMIRVGPDESKRLANVYMHVVSEREKRGAVPRLVDLFDTARELQLIRSKHRENHPVSAEIITAWKHQSEIRLRSELMIELHVALAKIGAPDFISRRGGIPTGIVAAITREKIRAYRMVPAEDISRLVEWLAQKGAMETAPRTFLKNWQATILPSFEAEVLSRIQAAKLTHHQLRDLLPHPRDTTKKPTLTLIRRTLLREATTSSISAGLLAHLVATSEEDLLNLMGMKKVKLWDEHMQACRTVSPQMIERHLWNIGVQGLPGSRSEQRQADTGTASAAFMGELSEALTSRASLARDSAVEKWLQRTEIVSVGGLLDFLRWRVGINRATQLLGIDDSTLHMVLRGVDMVSFPVVMSGFRSFGESPSEPVIQDWFYSMGTLLAQTGMPDLERVVRCYLAAIGRNEREACRQLGIKRVSLEHIFLKLRLIGTISEAQLKTLIRMTKMPEEVAEFATMVWQVGSIACALREIVQTRSGKNLIHREPRSTRDDLPLQTWYREGRRIFCDITRTSRKKALSLRTLQSVFGKRNIPVSFFPGATKSEMDVAQEDPYIPKRDFAEMMLRRLSERKVSPEFLVWVLGKEAPSHMRFRPDEGLTALLKGSFGSSLSMGSLGVLAAADSTDLERNLTLARQAAEETYHLSGIRATAAQVEMSVWGVTLERLVSRGHRSIRKVLSPDDGVQRELVEKAHAVGLSRMAKMVSSVKELIDPKSPREMVQHLHAFFHSLPVKMAPRLKPNIQPVLADLKRATGSASEPLTYRAAIKWHLQFPSYLGNRSLLARACMTAVAGVVAAPVQSRAKSTTSRFSALFASYLTALKIPKNRSRDHIYRSVLTGDIKSKSDLISLFNRLKLLPHPIPYLSRILAGEPPIDAVLSELVTGSQSLRESVVRLVDFLTADSRIRAAESPPDMLARMIDSLRYADEGVVEVLQTFPGIPATVWLDTRKAILSKVPRAVSVSEMQGTLLSRLGVLASAAEECRTITTEEILSLFPDQKITQDVRMIADFSKEGAGFYLAASLFFYDSITAIQQFAIALPLSPIPRDPLSDYRHFRDHSVIWQKSHGRKLPVNHIDTWFRVGVVFPTPGTFRKK